MKELIETLAVYTYIVSVAAMALMWVAANKDTEKKPARRNKREENSEPFIICGKGFEDQEDRITMTKAITPEAGAMYVHLSGVVYKCLRMTSDGCAVLMDINNGTLVKVTGCREYPDGKIDWGRCIEKAAVC